MDNEIYFRQMLTELKDAAFIGSGVLTKEEIHEIFKDIPLEESHYQLIYEYLAEQNIPVVESREEALKEGKKPADGPAGKPGEAGDASGKEDTEGQEAEGQRSLEMYLDDLAALDQIDEDTEISLISKLRAGDDSVRDALISLYLPLVPEMASEYEEQEGLPVEDLIQEGNLGLMRALDSLADCESTASCRVRILNTIRESMENAQKEGLDYRKEGDDLADKINHLSDALAALSRELGHKVSAEEASAYLDMPAEEIEDLLRVAGDQIDQTGRGGIR